jgi:hypothetical protein
MKHILECIKFGNKVVINYKNLILAKNNPSRIDGNLRKYISSFYVWKEIRRKCGCLKSQKQ